MLTTLTDYNKVTRNPLEVWYEIEPYEEYPLSVVQKVTRYATKNYSYIGIDYDTAKAGAKEKTLQYTAFKREYSFDGTNITWQPAGQLPVADVRPEKVEGGLYALDVDVNQQDSMVLSVNSRNVGQQNFDYDEEFNWIGIETDENNSQLKITNIYRDSTSMRTIIDYSQNIDAFNYQHVYAYSVKSPYEDWTLESGHVWYDGQIRLDADPSHAKWFRLKYVVDLADENSDVIWSGMVYLPKVG